MGAVAGALWLVSSQRATEASGTAPLPPLQRPTWLEIDRTALAANVGHLRQAIGADCRLMAVVKANAYGHGAVTVARTALQAGADQLAVAAVNEGTELRAAGIEAPILVLGYTPGWQAADLIRHDLTATVYDVDVARTFSAAATKTGANLSIHVKVDTGMHRLGVYPEDAPAFLAILSSLPGLAVEGIYTHFSTADAADKDFTHRQFDRFDALLNELETAGLRPAIAHAANSAATLSLPETHLQMVRCGIALYGLHPSAETLLPHGFRPVLRWKAHIAQVKELQPGDAVSYGNTYVASTQRTVAVIPVGYADGFPRSPRNWQSVLVEGQLAPILGQVCMDQTIVDVTAIVAAGARVQAGDEAVLIGSQKGVSLSAETVATRLGTINYEVVSSLLARLPRVPMEG